MYESAKITNKLITNKGLYMQVFIPKITEQYFKNRESEECGIFFNDDKTITVEQRKKIYAIHKDIADFTGYTPEEAKQTLKLMYMIEHGYDEFSLKDCPASVASDYIDYLIDFCFVQNISMSDLGINRTCNTTKFLHMCLKHRKCCICGKQADMHHVDAIGRGFDRTKVDDSKMRKMSLCREHHGESHTIGQTSFNDKYHVYGILYTEDDNELVRLSDILLIS